MHLRPRAHRPIAVLLASFAAALACTSARAAPAQPRRDRVVIAPRFTAGESMIYVVETRTSAYGKVAGPIDNPESPTKETLTATFRVRLDILNIAVVPNGQTVRLRATWLASHAQAASDAVDPAAPDPAAPFTQLEGRSLDFTLAPGGAMSQFRGLEDLPGGAAPPAALVWIASLISSNGFPKSGLSQNQQWSADQPLTGVPLAGLVWHAQSTFLRSEPCKPVASPATSHAPTSSTPLSAQCASILTRLTIAHRSSAHGDATPPDYLHNGLRTSGTWDGSGEGLGSFSLGSGLLVSGTQTSTQSYDYQIQSAATGSSIHYTGKVEGQTAITLVELDYSQPQATPQIPEK